MLLLTTSNLITVEAGDAGCGWVHNLIRNSILEMDGCYPEKQ
jgi:hypothetical protein